ncbi:MAG: hypothetical protein ACPGSB_07225 [Opitutales bacterium]
MKLPKVLLGLFVWLASVGAAYYLGTNIKSREAPQISADRPINSDIEITHVPETPPASPEPILEPVLEPTVSSLAELGIENLREALSKVDGLSETEARALLDEALALPFNDYRRGPLLRSLLSQLAETAPRDALALAQNIGSLRETESARIAILEVWAGNDPASAMAWAEVELANEPLRSRNNQLLAIYRGYAVSDPQAAFATALAMPSGNTAQQRLQTNALEEIITEQIENGGLQDAKTQVELLEDGPLKDSLLSDLVDRWASFDPVGAAAYVDSLGGEVPSSVKARLLGEWAENDPQSAAEWLNGREVDENTLGRASQAIIREWTRYDMEASAEWLNSQPSSPALDRAVMSYTYRAAQEDPASAMSWAESIDSDWMRTRMMQHVAGTWKNDNPEAFQSYIDNSGFDDEQKKKLQDADAIHGSRGRWYRD